MAEHHDNPSRPPQFPEIDENGVDLSVLRANLRLTPTERVRRAEARARLMAQRAHDQPGDAPAVGDSMADVEFTSGRAFQPWPEQDEHGVDLSLLRAQLRLTPTERIRRADEHRRSALHVRQHARRIR